MMILNISGALGQLFEGNHARATAPSTPWQLADRGKRPPRCSNGGRVDQRVCWRSNPSTAEISAEVRNAWSYAREAARAAKENWKRSDELRDAIATLGWGVKDTKDGQKIFRLA